MGALEDIQPRCSALRHVTDIQRARWQNKTPILTSNRRVRVARVHSKVF